MLTRLHQKIRKDWTDDCLNANPLPSIQKRQIRGEPYISKYRFIEIPWFIPASNIENNYFSFNIQNLNINIFNHED